MPQEPVASWEKYAVAERETKKKREEERQLKRPQIEEIWLTQMYGVWS